MRTTAILISAAFLLVTGAILPDSAAAHAALAANQSTAPATTPVAAASSSSARHLETFTGRILSQNGVRFILRDDTNEVWYHLDDQQKAGKFIGKKVRVTGALDGRTDTIHISSIIAVA